MIDKEKIVDILCERVLIHQEDPVLEDLWNELIEILSEDMYDTINFLNNCSKELLYYISEVFDDIYLKFDSKEFIDALYVLDEKFPELEIDKDIKFIEKRLS